MTDSDALRAQLRALGRYEHSDLSISFDAADALEEKEAEIGRLREREGRAYWEANGMQLVTLTREKYEELVSAARRETDRG